MLVILKNFLVAIAQVKNDPVIFGREFRVFVNDISQDSNA